MCGEILLFSRKLFVKIREALFEMSFFFGLVTYELVKEGLSCVSASVTVQTRWSHRGEMIPAYDRNTAITEV